MITKGSFVFKQMWKVFTQSWVLLKNVKCLNGMQVATNLAVSLLTTCVVAGGARKVAHCGTSTAKRTPNILLRPPLSVESSGK